MKLTFGISTVASPLHQVNQDVVEVINGNTAILVDAMGGEANPAQASKVALEVIKSGLTDIPQHTSPEQNRVILERAIRSANTELLKNVPGGGATVSVAKIIRGESDDPLLIYANTGDSRITLFREESLVLLTQDQGVLRVCYEDIYGDVARQYGLKRPDISRYETIKKKLDEVLDIATLDEEERVYFDHRNIVSGGIGIAESPVIDAGIGILTVSDIVILMSDGVHDNLTTQQIEEVLRETKGYEASEQAEKLVHRAKEVSEKGDKNGRSKLDDITVMIFSITEE